LPVFLLVVAVFLLVVAWLFLPWVAKKNFARLGTRRLFGALSG
jgi:hypothetical protein